MFSRTTLGAFGFAAMMELSSCSARSHSRPDDMSVAAHQRAAAGDDRQAAIEQSEYDPRAHRITEVCSGGLARSATVEPCWQEDVNPTAQHLREAQRWRRLAEQHRQASHVLQHAEDNSCQGISEHNRDTSPFSHAKDILAVEDIAPDDSGHVPGSNVTGVRVVFRPVQGLTVEGMRRIVDCHVARNAAMGHDDPEMDFCPLVPEHIHVRVVETPAGIAVDTTSTDVPTVRDLRARAERLRIRVLAASQDGEPLH